jgi:hypothetical protein
MDNEMRAALELRLTLNRRDIDVHHTRAGHWHADNVACMASCPMAGYGRMAVRHARMLATAAGWPHRNPYL